MSVEIGKQYRLEIELDCVAAQDREDYAGHQGQIATVTQLNCILCGERQFNVRTADGWEDAVYEDELRPLEVEQ